MTANARDFASPEPLLVDPVGLVVTTARFDDRAVHDDVVFEHPRELGAREAGLGAAVMDLADEQRLEPALAVPRDDAEQQQAHRPDAPQATDEPQQRQRRQPAVETDQDLVDVGHREREGDRLEDLAAARLDEERDPWIDELAQSPRAPLDLVGVERDEPPVRLPGGVVEVAQGLDFPPESP